MALINHGGQKTRYTVSEIQIDSHSVCYELLFNIYLNMPCKVMVSTRNQCQLRRIFLKKRRKKSVPSHFPLMIWKVKVTI